MLCQRVDFFSPALLSTHIPKFITSRATTRTNPWLFVWRWRCLAVGLSVDWPKCDLLLMFIVVIIIIIVIIFALFLIPLALNLVPWYGCNLGWFGSVWGLTKADHCIYLQPRLIPNPQPTQRYLGLSIQISLIPIISPCERKPIFHRSLLVYALIQDFLIWMLIWIQIYDQGRSSVFWKSRIPIWIQLFYTL